MKRLLIASLLLTFATVTYAQAPAQAQRPDGPLGVVVMRHSWYDNTHRQGWDDPVFTAKNKVEDIPEVPKASSRSAATPPQDPALNANRNLPAPFDPKEGVPRKIEQYVYSVKIKNEGEKKIDRLVWDYVFVDASTKQVLGHHLFRSSTHIGARSSATLTGTSLAPPSRVVNAKAVEKDAQKPFVEYVVIRCVAYSDGTLWRHPAAAGENGCAAAVAKQEPKGKG